MSKNSLCIPHTLYAYHHKKEMNGSEAGGFLMMFELKHSTVSVISYQVHTCDATIQQNCCTLFRKTLKKTKIVLWEDFLSHFLLYLPKKLVSYLTHDIFVLLCKITFLTHFSAFTHFFQKNYFTYQHFWEDDYKSWGLFSKFGGALFSCLSRPFLYMK